MHRLLHDSVAFSVFSRFFFFLFCPYIQTTLQSYRCLQLNAPYSFIAQSPCTCSFLVCNSISSFTQPASCSSGISSFRKSLLIAESESSSISLCFLCKSLSQHLPHYVVIVDLLNSLPYQALSNVDEFDSIKIKNYCSLKGIVKEMKGQPHTGRKFLHITCLIQYPCLCP